MFGYVKTDLPNLYVKDTVLYKALYCGLCKGIGKCTGCKGRLLLSYDLTFLSALMHNVLGVDVKVEREKCIVHPFKKRPVAQSDDLTKKIACLNVILAYHKLRDDVIDDGKGRLKKAIFTSNYKKARRLEPKLDEIVKHNYENLLKLEKSNTDSIDIIAEPFGKIMEQVVANIVGQEQTENLSVLAYNLGKWIYLIDALDDFDKDKKKGQYNVFVNAYTDAKDKKELISKHGKDLIFTFGMINNEISEITNKLDYKFNHDLTDNILHSGLRITLKEILENKKCKNIIKL